MYTAPIAKGRSVISSAEFARFFTALWGVPPFAWQADLAVRVLAGEDLLPAGAGAASSLATDGDCSSTWPDAIALPTASGKTACMDVALFALASQASRLRQGQKITAPRRIFFVVDRRVIVDEAHERARRLAHKLACAEDGILKAVADDLRRIAHGAATAFEGEQPLAVHVLRGGMYRSEGWARNPLQPTIVASTVDQIGSRLLFRAYGRGAGTWPIYAGLVANDSLVLLDEAHCAQPFLQTLRAIRRYRSWAQQPLGRCFHPVVMSATPPPECDDVFRDESDEGRNRHHALGQRQLANKPAALRPVRNASGDDEAFVKALVRSAQSLLDGTRHAIVVFANRVATARAAYQQLREGEDVDAILLTGRMRQVDKDVVAQRLRDLGLYSNRAVCRRLERPAVVVATQTLEVGADLDFDGLVTECASLDALRQRFGRLNRMGRSIQARAEILIRTEDAKPPRNSPDDPVYGKALTRTWKWLDDHKDESGEIDFGIAHFERLLPDEDALADLNAPSPDAPVMLPAHMDCWAQTAPAPQPSPDVAHFLHGPREGAPDVQVCWRADIDLADEQAQEAAIESLTLCPPASGETLPVRVGVFKRWLAGQDVEDIGADVEGLAAGDDSDAAEGDKRENCRVLRWRGSETSQEDVTNSPADIRPGDVIAIPATHPGAQDRLGDLPLEASTSPATLDVGDSAHRTARAKPILRLYPALVDAWPDGVTAKAAARSLLSELRQRHEDDAREIADEVRGLLAELAQAEALPEGWSWLPQAAKELSDEFRTVAALRRACRFVGDRSLILAGHRRIKALAQQEAASFSDEDDATASGISHQDGKPVPLRTHLPGVEAFARSHAVGCGLPDELTDAVARAGLLHDLGKADPRFQAMLRGGSPWVTGEILAKSAEMPKAATARRRVRAAAGYPAGGRHELLSVRLAESAPALLPEDDDLRDLVLHLVASHHGHCRPFAPVVMDDDPPPVEYVLCDHRMRWTGPTDLERLDSGVAERYWRLTRRYGWWGLAWLEALLRLADWRRSEWEEAHDAGE